MKNLSEYDISEDAFNLRDAMNDILEHLVAVYQSYNVPLPTRRYWTIGTPVIDCEQAVVTLLQVYLGTPGDEAVVPQPCDAPRSMVVQINIARPQSLLRSGAPPTPAMIQNDAEWAAIDTYIIMDSLQSLQPWQPVGPGMVATAAVPDPEGEFFTAQVQLTMVLP